MSSSRLVKWITLLLLFMLLIPSYVLADSSLLHNGDFESWTENRADSWYMGSWETEEGYTTYQKESPGHDGGSCVAIENLVANDARFAQEVKVEPNTLYKLSGYINVSGASGASGANLSFENTFVSTPALLDTQGQWQYVDVYGVTGDNQTELVIYVRLGGYSATTEGRAMFDDVQLEKLADNPNIIAQSLATSTPSGTQSKAKEANYIPLLLFVLLMAGIIYWGIMKRLDGKSPGQQPSWGIIALALLGAFALRLMLAGAVYGYENDIGCWLGWSSTAASGGLFNIYNNSTFLDYPPGYLYILYFLGLFNQWFHIGGAAVLIVKLPAILCDMVAALIVYRMAATRLGNRAAWLLGLLYLLNPMAILDSSAWGQIDSILALTMLGFVWEIYSHRTIRAAVWFAIGLLIKPQMLMLGPILLAAFIVEVSAQKDFKKGCTHAAKIIGTGIGVFLLPLVPFFVNIWIQSPSISFFQWLSDSLSWVVGLYTGTLGQYNNASINAGNLWVLLGGNWQPLFTSKIFYVPYGVWGYIAFGLATVAVIISYVRRKATGRVFEYTAFLLTVYFTLGPKMHERYLYPIMLLLIIAFILVRDRRLLWLYGLTTAVQFLNAGLVLSYVHLSVDRIAWGDLFAIIDPTSQLGFMTMVVSLGAVACLVYFIVYGIKAKKEKTKDLNAQDQSTDQTGTEPTAAPFVPVQEPEARIHWNRTDALLMLGLTAAYAVVAFLYLGSTKVPVTMDTITKRDNFITVDLGRETELSQIWDYYGLSSGILKVEGSNDMNSWQPLRSAPNPDKDLPAENMTINYKDSMDLFTWTIRNLDPDQPVSVRYVKFTCTSPTVRLVELAFKDTSGDFVPQPKVVEATEGTLPEASKVLDEQDRIPPTPGFYTGVYFDEIYHARTAWEFLNHIYPYETTHPPLGKLIISLGIKMFQMTPFGWRFMGTLFGVLMVPMMYWLGKLLFKRSRYAFIMAFLFAFDFMHFTQTRIATIDTYGVFFIIGMFACMYWYWGTNYNRQPLMKTLLPLALCGLMFGLGAASKWICIYAGGGLAVMFFASMSVRLREYLASRSGRLQPDAQLISGKRYATNTTITLLWCLIFFVAIPAAIYLLSYIPYQLTDPSNRTLLQVCLDNQKSMFDYHSTPGLGMDHYYYSPWYQWPLMFKPMYYYRNYWLPQGYMGSIAAFGNPLVWLPGAAAMVWAACQVAAGRKFDKAALFIILGFLTQYLPWVFVPRSMFIYHYFADIPFLVAAIVLFISRWERQNTLRQKYVLWYMIGVIALFVFFYPVLSGLPIPSWYGALTKWLPSWMFTY